jgi:hypothetical protein
LPDLAGRAKERDGGNPPPTPGPGVGSSALFVDWDARNAAEQNDDLCGINSLLRLGDSVGDAAVFIKYGVRELHQQF